MSLVITPASLSFQNSGSAPQTISITDPTDSDPLVSIVASPPNIVALNPSTGSPPLSISVVPIAEGTTTITATDDQGNTATCTVTVKGRYVMALQDLENKVLWLVDEPGWNPGGEAAPPTGADWSLAQIDSDLNEAIEFFLMRTGLAPHQNEAVLTLSVTATTDFVLPVAAEAIVRIEYLQGGSTLPYPLRQLSFENYDYQTGPYPPGATIGGSPWGYREPFAGLTRFFPQPTSGNVTAGDKVIIYYTSIGTQLVNPTDIPGIPPQFSGALVCFCLGRYWARKQDDAQSKLYLAQFEMYVRAAKAYSFDKNQDTYDDLGFVDCEESIGWGPLRY